MTGSVAGGSPGWSGLRGSCGFAAAKVTSAAPEGFKIPCRTGVNMAEGSMMVKRAATVDKETVRMCEEGKKGGRLRLKPCGLKQAQAATHASLYPIIIAAAKIDPYYNTLVQLGCGDNRIFP